MLSSPVFSSANISEDDDEDEIVDAIIDEFEESKVCVPALHHNAPQAITYAHVSLAMRQPQQEV